MAQAAIRDQRPIAGEVETKGPKGHGKDKVDKSIKSHLHYIENPPTDLKSAELIDEYWFILDNGKVIVEPPIHYRSGKHKAYVWVISESFRKKIIKRSYNFQWYVFGSGSLQVLAKEYIYGKNTLKLVKELKLKNPWMELKVMLYFFCIYLV